MIELTCAALLLCGSGIVLVAALGVVRMPDAYLRIQVVTKAVTLGTLCLLLSLVLQYQQLEIVWRAGLMMVFITLTAPIGAHLLARACYLSGVALWKNTDRDDLKGRYDRATHRLSSK